jgi:hypothetical protein
LCHGADATNALARCTLTERRIRGNYARATAVIDKPIIGTSIRVS